MGLYATDPLPRVLYLPLVYGKAVVSQVSPEPRINDPKGCVTTEVAAWPGEVSFKQRISHMAVKEPLVLP